MGNIAERDGKATKDLPVQLAMFHNLNPRAEERTKNQKAVHKIEGKVYPQKQTKKDEPALLSLY